MRVRDIGNKRISAILIASAVIITLRYGFSGYGRFNLIQTRSAKLRETLWVPFANAYSDATAATSVLATGSHQRLTKQQMEDARRSWQQFLDLAPSYEQVKPLFQDRGLVISGGAYQLHLAYACIKMLRESGCTLPIDLWVSSGRNETLSPAHIRLLTELDVQVYDTDVVANTFGDMERQMHPTSPRTKPYILKQIGLLSARCEECLMLDADNIPVRDPTFLFETPEYLGSGHLLWPDFWHMRGGPAAIREIFGLPQGHGELPDTRSVESGQMVVHKRKAWRSLLLSVFMQVQTEFYDNLMRELHHLGGGGDKQTFIIGCLATNSSCHIVRSPVASAGRMMGGVYCGRTMIQHAPDGTVLFVHANMDKERYHVEMLAAEEWSEDLRRCNIIKQPNTEGSWTVSFVHQQACQGGGWVVQVGSDSKESRLTDHVGFDFEKRKFELVKEFEARYKTV
eukprot:m.34925 g.34925  ORF g.34925 m.34925 type:complete len:454 (+) comp12354_c0_seq1:69-1430(+)